MTTEFANNIRVTFLTLKEANEAIAFMRAKLKESIGHWVSVYDLIGCCSLAPDFAYRFTSGELNDWGWTSIDGFSLEKSPIRGAYILTMPPARKNEMINPNLRQIIEEKFKPDPIPSLPMFDKYIPIAPPPEPYIPRKDGKSMKNTMDICKEICGTKAKLEISDELNSYSGPMYMPLTVPSREEILKDICVFRDYDIVQNQIIITMKYENKLTDLTVLQEYALDSESRILCDADHFDMWYDARREEMANAVTKAYENKKKEQEKEKLKMYFNNSDAVYEKIYKEDDTVKKSKPVKSVEITNIEMYNDRVVKVTFDDGSFTKSVCQENDIFDLDVGITVCLMKKMLDDGKGNGTRIYNDIIRDAHKLINDKENEKIEKQMEKEKRKKKAHKAQMKKQAKKLKAKEEAIDIQKQAYIRALQETGMIQDGE